MEGDWLFWLSTILGAGLLGLVLAILLKGRNDK